jgi:DNA (cytosine-5)-methyltransferase 1
VNVDARTLRVLSLCSGVGMHDLGLSTVFHARTVCYVEREAFSASQLVALMEAECLDVAPVWSDLATFDAGAWRGVVDCLVAGLPCQPYSVAGKREGNDDRRAFGEGDGPIVHFLRIVAECRPAVVFLENVPAWVTGGWFRPVGDELCRLGYELEAPLFLAADDVGASHQRERVWLMAYEPGRGQRVVRESWRGVGCAEQDGGIMAHTESAGGQLVTGSGIGAEGASAGEVRGGPVRSEQRATVDERIAAVGGEVGQSDGFRPERHRTSRRWSAGPSHDGISMGNPCSVGRWLEGDGAQPPVGADRSSLGLFAPGPRAAEWERIIDASPWLAPATEPGVHGVADGLTLVVDESRRHQLRALGNGGVPLCSAVAWGTLARRLLA